MADVDSVTFTTTKVRKTKKTTMTKRRDSKDTGDVSITEITEKENHLPGLTNGVSNRRPRYLLVFRDTRLMGVEKFREALPERTFVLLGRVRKQEG